MMTKKTCTHRMYMLAITIEEKVNLNLLCCLLKSCLNISKNENKKSDNSAKYA